MTVPPNSDVLVLTLVAGSPELARDGSAAMAQAYLDRRKSEAVRGVAGMVTALEAQRADLNANLVKVTKALGTAPTETGGEGSSGVPERAPGRLDLGHQRATRRAAASRMPPAVRS